MKMTSKLFYIAWPKTLGPDWLNVDNLRHALYELYEYEDEELPNNRR